MVGALFVALALLGQSPATVSGDHGGRPIGSLLACDRPVTPPRCTSVGNNHRHYVYFDEGLSEGLAASLRDAMAEDYTARTNLVMVEQPRMTSTTDVIAFSNDYGDNGAAGWVYCRSDATRGINVHGDRWCRHQELFFNVNPRFSVFFADDGSRDHVACHELGHTLGLRHWGNPPTSAGPAADTCMHGNTPNGPTDLHQIDVDHLNAYYPLPDATPRTDLRRRIAHETPEHIPAVTAFGGAVVRASELEHYASIEGMARAADAVVRGRIEAVEPGRVFGLPGRSPLHYAAVTIQVDEVLAGGLSANDVTTVSLELPLFDGPASIAAMRSSLPSASGLFFLRHKADAPAEPDLYRLAILRGVILDDGGRAAVVPGEDDFLAALDGVAFEELVGRVRATRR